MRTSGLAILLIILGTFLTSTAQIFYKTGADRLSLSFVNMLTNFYLPVGVFIYILAGVLMLVAFKHGEVSVLYPIFATSYIWVMLSSRFFFGEAFNMHRWIGVGIIVFGITLVSIGGNKKKEQAIESGEVV